MRRYYAQAILNADINAYYPAITVTVDNKVSRMLVYTDCPCPQAWGALALAEKWCRERLERQAAQS